MTVATRRRQLRDGAPLSAGGWGGWQSDPSVIPPNSVYATSSAGSVVNERTVMSLMVVASCVRVLGDAVAGLDVHVYRQKGTRRSNTDKEVDPPQVIAEPYADMDREQGDFALTASLGLGGNLYKHIVDRDDKGNPLQVEVLNPSAIKVEMIGGFKTYKLGAVGAVIPTADIVHIPWIYLASALVGVNPIEIGANGFGIPLAEQEYSGRFFSQGMHPTGILSIQKPMREDDMERVQQELFVKHGGLAQSHTPIVLDAATKWQQITVNPETAQLLQSRAFSRGEIAGFYGVPPHLVGDNSGSGGPWGKGLQELVMGFAMFSLSGYTKRLDRADTQLLPAGYYAKRKVSDLFATNSQMLGAYVNMLRMAAIATPNEARELAGLPPVDEPGSDSIFAPINSAHADFLAEGDEGAESGLPGGLNPKGVPNGSDQGGQAAPQPGAGA